MFNQEYIQATLLEAADIAATRLAQKFALVQMGKTGSCTLEEAENLYNLASKILTEGAQDLIPETLELPEDEAPADAPAADTEDMGGDLDLSDLEGIVLPDSEGNQYIIQDGILVPYEEESDDDAGIVVGSDDAASATDAVDPATAGATDATDEDAEEEELDESTGVVAGSTDNVTQAIEENSIFVNNSSIVSNLLKNMKI